MIDVTASEVFSSPHSHIVQNSIFDTSSSTSSAAQQLLSNSLPMFNVVDENSTTQASLSELNTVSLSVGVNKKKSKANIWTKLAKQFPPNVEYSSNHIAVFITGPPGSGKTTQIDLLSNYCKKSNIELSVQIGKELKKEAVRQLSSKYDVKQFEKKHSGEEPKLDALSQEFAQQKALRCCLLLRKNLNSAEERLAQSAAAPTASSPLSTTSTSSSSSLSTTATPPPVFYLYSRGPHCKEQAQFLHQKLNIRPNIYIVLEMNNQSKLIERINKRRYDPVTKKTYSMQELETLTSENKIEPEVLARLQERVGDNAVNYPKRMKKYLSRSSVVLDYYEHELGVTVTRINAERNKEEVFADIVAAINPILGRYGQKQL